MSPIKDHRAKKLGSIDPRGTVRPRTNRSPLSNPGPLPMPSDADHTDSPPAPRTDRNSSPPGGTTNADKVLGTVNR